MAEINTVYIGSEYRATFESLVRILESGCIPPDGARCYTDGAGRKVISAASYEFILSDRTGGTETPSRAVAMTGDGASWFAPVRNGVPFDDGSAEWKQLIYKVARSFHKKYSIIEYKPCDDDAGLDGEESAELIQNVVKRLFGAENISVAASSIRGTEDIYGASVKLELSGAGQSHYTVMSKVYFRRINDKVAPIYNREAAVIDRKLLYAPDNDAGYMPPDSKINVTDVTLQAMENLVKGNYSVKFRDALCFNSEPRYDEKTGKTEENHDYATVKELCARSSFSKSPINCSSVSVLGISHVKLNNDYFDVFIGGRKFLRAVVGFGGSITLRCLNCGGTEEIISANNVTYKVTDENGRRVTRSFTVDPSKPDLGLTDGEVKEIRTNGAVSEHFLTVRCKNNIRLGKDCVVCACKNQTVELNGELKCAACLYPEEIFTDYSGERPVRMMTSSLAFALDEMTMVRKEQAKKCACCGRQFTESALKNGVCSLCASISDLTDEEKKRAQKLYGKYRGAFSFGVRIKHIAHKKYCVEDDTAVLFSLGGELYALFKTQLSESGFLAQPKRISV